MPIRTAIWKVGSQPQLLAESSLEKERLLEEMIVADPRVLSDEWMLIGRQEDNGFGGRIDLLAIAPDGSLVLIELKRSRTPREVVAQAIDYAGWVEKLRAEDIAAIYNRFAPGHSLTKDFRERFRQGLDEETLNQSHQIIIVASSLDDSTERIVAYLSDRDIPINVLCFQIFTHGTEQLLSRAWLLDPIHTQIAAAATPVGSSEPWNGSFIAPSAKTRNVAGQTPCSTVSSAGAGGRGTARLSNCSQPRRPSLGQGARQGFRRRWPSDGSCSTCGDLQSSNGRRRRFRA
jgi:hypothetical protein